MPTKCLGGLCNYQFTTRAAMEKSEGEVKIDFMVGQWRVWIGRINWGWKPARYLNHYAVGNQITNDVYTWWHIWVEKVKPIPGMKDFPNPF